MTDIASLGIRVSTTGAKEASRDLNKLTKDAIAGERAAKRIGKAWGLALGGAIVAGAGIAAAGLKKYIANTIEAEKVQASLIQRIKSTGGAAGLAVGDLNKMAAALQFKTSFDDESIGKVQALLLTFTKLGRDVFPKATEAVLDMSTALGTDLNSAALQVGKALNDPVKGITALSRAGVQFSESQKETIKNLVKTGDVAAAQTIILKELETQMGGSAVAARNTLGGALQALENSFDNLLEGDSGSAGIKGTRDAIEGFNKTLNDPGVKAGVDAIVSGILRASAALAEGISWWVKWGQARSIAMSGGSIAGSSDVAAQARLDQIATKLEKINLIRNGGVSVGKRAKLAVDIGFEFDKGEVKKLENERDKIIKGLSQRQRAAGVGKMVDDAFAAAKARGQDPAKFASGIGDDEGGSKKFRAAKAIKPRELPDFGKQDAADLADLIEKEQRATDAYRDMAATLSGPLAVAELDHQKNIAEINALASISAEASAGKSALLAAEAERYNKSTAAIKAQLDPTAQLLDDMRFELSLMGMSNDAREKAIALRQADASATAAQIVQIGQLSDAMAAASKQQQFADQTQRDLSDSLASFVDGTKSAKDAFGDFADSLYKRAIQFLADKAIQSLFDAFGGMAGKGSAGGGGSTGGGWISAIAGLFGGGRANGGPVSAGRMYEVGERGPEVLTMHGRNFMIPSAAGHVTPPAPAAQNRTSNFNQTVVVQGLMGRRTAAQLATEASREQMRQTSRNR